MHESRLRRTGRTTRMIEEAEALAHKGRAVYLLFNSSNEAAIHERVFGREKAQQLGMKFESINEHPRFNLNIMKPEFGCHPNCAWIVDHHVLEVHFSEMLEHLHRYDNALVCCKRKIRKEYSAG